MVINDSLISLVEKRAAIWDGEYDRMFMQTPTAKPTK